MISKPLLVLSATVLISGCSTLSFFGNKPEKEIVVQTKLVERRIPLQSLPKPVTLGDPTFYVVTEETFDEFINKLKKETGDTWVFYAMSVQSYETLALNVAEIRRYLEQQKAIIVYYENSITESVKKPEEKQEER